MEPRLMNHADNAFSRTILDALPIPVFVVNDDVQIWEVNQAAVQLCGQNPQAIYRRRSGDVLHCIHATETPEGCGRSPSCRQCVIRNSVTKCLQGQTISRMRMKMTLAAGSAKEVMEMLITTSPITSREGLALLIIEDISELMNLRNIIPICMKCKRVRDDEQYWKEVEHYFHQHVGVDFSHGICPACVKDFYPELRTKPS